MSHKILSPELAQLLFLVVALSMALTPFLAEAGQKVGKAFGKNELKVRLKRHTRRVLQAPPLNYMHAKYRRIWSNIITESNHSISNNFIRLEYI